MAHTETVTELKNAIAHYPDFPKPGILFQDLSPLFKDKHLYKKLLDLLTDQFTQLGGFDYIVGIEARGFILGAALASRVQCGFIPLRKKGKLPGKITQVKYDCDCSLS
jgi:adenine phosphoribosyltransferase